MILITTQITGIEQALSKIKSKSIRNDALKKLDEIKIALKEIQKEAGYLEVLRSVINPNTDWAFPTQESIAGLFEAAPDVSKDFEKYRNPFIPDPARVESWKKRRVQLKKKAKIVAPQEPAPYPGKKRFFMSDSSSKLPIVFVDAFDEQRELTIKKLGAKGIKIEKSKRQ